jgi:hypothetical protein
VAQTLIQEANEEVDGKERALVRLALKSGCVNDWKALVLIDWKALVLLLLVHVGFVLDPVPVHEDALVQSWKIDLDPVFVLLNAAPGLAFDPLGLDQLPLEVQRVGIFPHSTAVAWAGEDTMKNAAGQNAPVRVHSHWLHVDCGEEHSCVAAVDCGCDDDQGSPHSAFVEGRRYSLMDAPVYAQEACCYHYLVTVAVLSVDEAALNPTTMTMAPLL